MNTKKLLLFVVFLTLAATGFGQVQQKTQVVRGHGFDRCHHHLQTHFHLWRRTELS